MNKKQARRTSGGVWFIKYSKPERLLGGRAGWLVGCASTCLDRKGRRSLAGRCYAGGHISLEYVGRRRATTIHPSIDWSVVRSVGFLHFLPATAAIKPSGRPRGGGKKSSSIQASIMQIAQPYTLEHSAGDSIALR